MQPANEAPFSSSSQQGNIAFTKYFSLKVTQM